jgi:Type VI secretion system VasI, EvfG, VC_A0118
MGRGISNLARQRRASAWATDGSIPSVHGTSGRLGPRAGRREAPKCSIASPPVPPTTVVTSPARSRWRLSGHAGAYTLLVVSCHMVTNGGGAVVVWVGTNARHERAARAGSEISALLAMLVGCRSPEEVPTRRSVPETKTPPPSEARPAQIVPDSPPPQPPAWQPFSQTDAIDDSMVVGVKLVADEVVQMTDSRQFRPKFWIGCKKDTTSAYFDVGTILSSETRSWESDEAYGYKSGTQVRLRIDKEPPISEFGGISADGASAFLSNPISSLKKMIGHSTLLVEYSPLASAPRTTRFTITGINDAMAELRKACHW